MFQFVKKERQRNGNISQALVWKSVVKKLDFDSNLEEKDLNTKIVVTNTRN